MAKQILKLANPIKVNNKVRSELAFDYFEITNDLYLEASMRSSRIGNTMNASAVREMNEPLALCLGKAAILAANSDMMWEDLDQLKGFDLLDIANIGRFFITRKVEALGSAPSEKQSEPTPNDSTQA